MAAFRGCTSTYYPIMLHNILKTSVGVVCESAYLPSGICVKCAEVQRMHIACIPPMKVSTARDPVVTFSEVWSACA